MVAAEEEVVAADVPERVANTALEIRSLIEFERQLVKIIFPLVERDFPLAHQAPEIAIRGNVVKAVIVDPGVRNMRRHEGERSLVPQPQKLFFAASIKLQQG